MFNEDEQEAFKNLAFTYLINENYSVKKAAATLLAVIFVMDKKNGKRFTSLLEQVC